MKIRFNHVKIQDNKLFVNGQQIKDAKLSDQVADCHFFTMQKLTNTFTDGSKLEIKGRKLYLNGEKLGTKIEKEDKKSKKKLAEKISRKSGAVYVDSLKLFPIKTLKQLDALDQDKLKSFEQPFSKINEIVELNLHRNKGFGILASGVMTGAAGIANILTWPFLYAGVTLVGPLVLFTIAVAASAYAVPTVAKGCEEEKRELYEKIYNLIGQEDFQNMAELLDLEEELQKDGNAKHKNADLEKAEQKEEALTETRGMEVDLENFEQKEETLAETKSVKVDNQKESAQEPNLPSHKESDREL